MFSRIGTDWYGSDRAVSWRQVVNGDPLLPGIYEFEPTGPIELSKINERNNHSLTTAGSKFTSSTFRKLITRPGLTDHSLHLILFRNVWALMAPVRFGQGSLVHTKPTTSIHTYARIEILLFSALGGLVDLYQLGFYHDMVRRKYNGTLLFPLLNAVRELGQYVHPSQLSSIRLIFQ